MNPARDNRSPIALLADPGDAWAEELCRVRTVAVDAYDDAWQLRSALLEAPAGIWRAVIGGSGTLEAVNVAAAVARDGHARSVTLVAEHPSGSLRSRAALASIAQVVEPEDLPAALGLDRQATDIGASSASPSDAPERPSGRLRLVEGGREGDGRVRGANEGARRSMPELPSIEDDGLPWEADLDEPDPADAPKRESMRLPHVALAEGESSALAGEERGRLRHKPFPGRLHAAREPLHAAPTDTMNLPAFGDGEPGGALAFHEGSGSSAPRLVLVSGRGGVGKSAIAALMAATAASWGMEVALLDLDLAFGNLFGYFGLDGPADLTPVASAGIAEELSHCGRGVAERLTLFGPCEKPEFSDTVAPLTSEILAELSRTHDLVVVDGGTSWGDAVAQAVQGADRLLVCSDERAGAIGTLSRVALLAVRLGVARTRICRLLNRCDPRHRDEGFISRADAGFETARPLSIYEGGIEVPELMSAGHAPELVDLPNPFSESVARHLAQILAELGVLPEDERARKAAGERGHAKRSEAFPFFKALAS